MDELKTIVKKFLKEIKYLITLKKLDIIPRKKNEDSLLQLELTLKDCPDAIMSLQVSDYHKGPEPDEDITDEDVWVFGKKLETKMFTLN